MNRISAQRDGFALAAAIMALVLVGALVTGGFYAASQEGRITSSARYTDEAFNLAEHGIHTVIGTWTLDMFNAITLDSSRTVVDTMRVGGRVKGHATVEVRRLGNWLYFLTSTGEVLGGGAGARRSLGMLVRTTNFSVSMDRALQVRGSLNVTGNGKIVGSDSVNGNWKNKDECTNTGSQTGVVSTDASAVTTNKSDAIVGTPAVAEDSSMNYDSFTKFGDWDYDELAARASKVISLPENFSTAPSLTSSGACNTAALENWGAPKDSTHACHYYFPIIHAKGSGKLTLGSNASGQGILLVDGDLDLGGGYEFNGIVIVKGKLTTGSGNAKVFGSVLVYNTASGSEVGEEGAESVVTGTPIINFSSCAVDRSVRYNADFARAYPINERSWFDLTAAGLGS